MSRLTKKETNTLSSYGYRTCEYLLNGTPRVKALNKLGKLEDLEDELGCPLEIVLNLIKNTNKLDKESRTQDIYFDYKGQLVEASFLSLSFEHNQFVFLVQTSLPDSIYDYESMTLNVKDHQKTWWLKGDSE